MAAPTTASAAAAHVAAPNSLQIPFVVLAAVLISAGLWSMTFFLITFQLPFMAGSLLVLAGALMLMDPRAGSDHA